MRPPPSTPMFNVVRWAAPRTKTFGHYPNIEKGGAGAALMKENVSFQDCSTPNGNAVISLPLECSVGSFGSEGAQTPRYLTSEDGIRTPSQRLRACPGPFPTQCSVSPASASALYPWRAACWCVGPGRGHTLSPPGPPAVAGPAVPRPSPRGNQQEQGRGRL